MEHNFFKTDFAIDGDKSERVLEVAYLVTRLMHFYLWDVVKYSVFKWKPHNEHEIDK